MRGMGISTIRLEVSIASSLNRVWLAWTSSDRITAWFAPEANVEARVGGPFELFFDPASHDRQSTKDCIFTLVEPMRRMGFTWRGPDQFAEVMNDPTSLTSVMVIFQDESGVTRVVVEHGGWGKGDEWEEARAWHHRAWKDVLGRLKSTLESG